MDLSNNEFGWQMRIGTDRVEDYPVPLLVVDTGIIVRAIGTSPYPECKRVVDLCIDGKITPCITEPIIHEYELIINRKAVEEGVIFNQESHDLLAKFLARCLILTGYPINVPVQIEKDSSDYKFLIAQALAFEGTGRKCSIVSRDGHLLDLPHALEENIVRADYFLYLFTNGLLA